MKKVLTILLFNCLILFAFSQDTTSLKPGLRRSRYQLQPNQPGVKLSIGAEFGQPAGPASNIYGSVVGASAKVEIPVTSPALNVILTAGFSGYLVRLDYFGPLKAGPAYYVPVEAGLRYFVSKIVYLEGDAGESFDVNSNYTAPANAFIYAPIIGVCAPTNKHKASIDLALRYEGRVESGGTVSQVALRLAYRFSL